MNLFVIYFSAYIEGENLATSSDPQYLLELLELVLQQFRIVAHTHRIVLANLTRIKVGYNILVLHLVQIKHKQFIMYYHKMEIIVNLINSWLGKHTSRHFLVFGNIRFKARELEN